MSTVPVRITIDRHPTNGTASIRGSFGSNRVELEVHRGATNGDAHIEGGIGSDRVELTFGRDAAEGYNSLNGHIGGRRLEGTIQRGMPDGDTTLSLNGHRLEIDRSNQGRQVDLRGDVRGHVERELREGDEQVDLTSHGLRFCIDRDPRSGGFEIRNTNSERYRLNLERDQDGDLHLEGRLPSQLGLFPVLWEVFGD
ncbi:MAG: hypothetical protein KC910_28105, partial [Candidatus Eremiobacteraeota bacterium]|nr:hypothetical protein [Candidatus Eremiobacteraeota bacterium]